METHCWTFGASDDSKKILIMSWPLRKRERLNKIHEEEVLCQLKGFNDVVPFGYYRNKIHFFFPPELIDSNHASNKQIQWVITTDDTT